MSSLLWFNMLTAPKDGSEVLLADQDGVSVGAGFWASEDQTHRSGEGWFWEADRPCLLTARPANPAFWMPLPASPFRSPTSA